MTREATDLKPGTLGEIAGVVMGQSPVGSSYNQDRVGVPLINGPTEFTARSPIPKQWTTAPVRFCKPDDALICVRGSSTGRMNIADAEYCIGRGVAAVRALDGNDQTFVKYALAAVVADLLKLQTGSTFPSIDSRVIRGGTVLIPERREQQRIGAALNDTDDLIAALERMIAKKQAVKQGMMQQLLTGKARLPGFTGELVERRLSDVSVKIQDGTHFSPQLGGSDFKYITSKNIGLGHMKLDAVETISEPEHRKIYSRCDTRFGDLLITKDGANTGNAALNPFREEISLLSSVAFVRCDPRMASEAYILQYLLSRQGRQQVKDAMAGNAITRLTLAKIRDLVVPMPEVDEQRALARVLGDADAEIASVRTRLRKACDVKRGMMQELLTGRTRLPLKEDAA